MADEPVEERRLGMRRVTQRTPEPPPAPGLGVAPTPATAKAEPKAKPRLTVNTRHSLWVDRWPAIALQSCIDLVEAAPPEEQLQVKNALPCMSCPESPRCLNAKRKEIGSLMYDREELTQPRTSESSLFPGYLIEPMLNTAQAFVPHYRKAAGVEHEYAVVQSWDFAWSEKTGGDWLVNMTGLLHLPTGRRTLLDISRWQGKTFDAQIRLIQKQWTMYEADLVVLETDAAQKIWKQRVERETPVPVISHDAGTDKGSLATGVPSLLVTFENRRWTFPAAPGSWHGENLRVFRDELEAFGWVDGKLQGAGEHDDTVMAFWHLEWAMQRRYMAVAADERHMGLTPGVVR